MWALVGWPQTLPCSSAVFGPKHTPWKNTDAYSFLLGPGISGNFQCKPRELRVLLFRAEVTRASVRQPPAGHRVPSSQKAGWGLARVHRVSEPEPKRSPHVRKSQTPSGSPAGTAPTLWRPIPSSGPRGLGGWCWSAGFAVPVVLPLLPLFAAGGTLRALKTSHGLCRGTVQGWGGRTWVSEETSGAGATAGRTVSTSSWPGSQKRPWLPG